MGTLYIVATPIGNLADITLRALRILKEVDLILCEDTRVTKKLLDHYQIKTPTMSYHQHSGTVKSEKVLNQLNQGKALALATDAGTPGVCDPGGKIIAEAVLAGHQVIPVPGPSAMAAAVAIAGLPLDKFLFLGFLPHKKGRQTLLKKIAESDYPVILYESVHRIEKLLSELNQSSRIVVCRELTKKFETIYRGTAEAVKAKLKPSEIKGEFTVIIEGKK